MKMRMRRLLSALALAASTAWGATEVTDDGYTWTYERANDGGVRIMGVDPDLEGEVAFPASLGGQDVVDVETSALQTENVTALTVPASLADSEVPVERLTGYVDWCGDWQKAGKVGFWWRLGAAAFPQLERVVIDGVSTRWETIGESVYSRNGTILVYHPPASDTLTLTRTVVSLVARYWGSICGPTDLLDGVSQVVVPDGDCVARLGDLGAMLSGGWELLTPEEEPLETLTLTRDVALRAFCGCRTITTVVLDKGVKALGWRAFDRCRNLAAVEGGAGVEDVGSNAFDGTPFFERQTGLVRFGNWVVGYNGDWPTTLVIPDGVTGASLNLNTDVKDLTLPASLRSGSISFLGDTVRVPSLDGWIHRTFSLTWWDCCGLDANEGYDLYAAERIVRAVTIPGSMRKVPEDLFRNCRSIQSVTFEAGIEQIGSAAFDSCGELRQATFPSSLRAVGGDAFGGCTNLVFTLPPQLDWIGYDAFGGTQTYAEAVAAAKEKGEVAYLGNWAIGWPYDAYGYYEDVEDVPCPESVVIREGTRGIMDDAFYGWASLKKVTLPKSLKVVGKCAFEDTSLERVALPAGLKWIGEQAFANTALSALPKLPASLEEIGWGAFGCFDDGEAEDRTPPWYARRANGWIVADGWLLGYKNANYVWDEGEGNWREDEDNPPPAPPRALTVPATVKHIAGFTWPEGDEMPEHELILPNRLETISAYAFDGLRTGALTIPASVKRIGEGAFYCVDGPISFLGRPPTLDVEEDGDMPFEDASIGYFAAGTPGWTDGMTYAGLKMRACSFVGGRLVPNVAVSLDIGGEGTVSGLGKESYAAGTKLNLKATAKRGHVFAGWRLEGVAFPENRNPLDPTLPLVVGEEAITVFASFIPVEEDWVAFTNGDFADEYETGGAFEPITLEVESTSLASVKVTGLPAGLKFTAKPLTVRATKTTPEVFYPANTIYGTPTRSGVYTVVATATTAGRTTAVKSWTVVMRKEGENFLKAECDPAMGRVTGGGIYADGKKATLKATPNRGFVFAGWYDADGEPLEGDVDFRSPSFPYTAAGEDVAVRASFIPVEEDWVAFTNGDFADEYETGGAFEPITLEVESASLASVKVTGLPTGLKFTAKPVSVRVTPVSSVTYPANTVYGAPTKSGVYTVVATATTAGRTTAVKSWTVVVRKEGENFLKAECDTAMGRVTGGGIYADGKKATLKATPNRGFVFAGWYDADGEPLEGDVDFRSPSFQYTAAGEDVAVWAEFIPAEDDTEPKLDVEDVYNVSGAFDLTLKIESRSLPKVTLSGLPSGLKFDNKTNRISGTATKPGTYTVTAKLTNASVRTAVVRTFTIVVDNLTGANDLLLVRDAGGDEAALLNARGDRYEISAGVREFDLPVLTARNEGDRLALSGLPAGLKYDAKTGRIGGVATKAGVYTVQASVRSGRASCVSTFTVEVKALPAWAVGTFAGIGLVKLPGYDLVEDNLYGTVTVEANGKLSGKFLFDTGDERLLTAAFSAPALTSWECDPEGDGYFLDVTLAFKDGRNVVESRECRFCIEQNNHDGGVGGGMLSLVDADGAEITLYQNVWKVKGFENLPVFAGKKTVVSKPLEIHGDDTVIGTSTLTLTFDQKGAVSGTLTDEGTEEGKPFSERFAFKSDLIVTRHWTDESGEYYEAEVPLVIGSFATARAVVKMRVLPDGKVHADGCEITNCTDFGDWE